MKKRILRLPICLALAICLLLSCAQAAVAPPIQVQYTGISTFSASLNIDGGVADCASRITMTNTSNTGILAIHLQQSSDNKNWTTLKSWSVRDSQTPVIALEKEYSVAPGYYYRLYCTARVYDPNGTQLGFNTQYSPVRRYP